MAARKKNRFSLHDTLYGRQPPLIKKPQKLDFSSTGKTLLSLKKHRNKETGVAQSSNRTTQSTKVSSSVSTQLSIVEETPVEISSCRVGTLQEIPVFQCLLTSEDISLKMVAKATPIKYTIYSKEISEIKMNLSESQRCMMIKVHPLPSRKLSNRLRSQFKVCNQRFLNVESRNYWEWYWFLKIDIQLDQNTITGIHEWLNKLEKLKVKVERDMSGEEVKQFLTDLNQQSTVGLYSAQPTDVYNPPHKFKDVLTGDVTRRSSRIQNKENHREKQSERLRRMKEK